MSRTRLVELASTGRIVVLEAHAGAGKTAVLEDLAATHDGPTVRVTLTGPSAGYGQLAARLRRSLLARGLSDLATECDPSQVPPHGAVLLPTHDETRLLVVIDDVHLADDELSRCLVRTVEQWPAGHRLVLAGRRLPGSLPEVLGHPGSLVVDGDDLRFRTEETRRLLGQEVTERLDRDDVAVLTDRCDGWAAALELATVHLRRAAVGDEQAFRREVDRVLAGAGTLGDLVMALLDDAPVDVRAGVRRIARLPLLDDEILQAAGLPEGLAAVSDLGLPLAPSGDGLWTLPDVVREALVTGADTDRADDAAGIALDRLAAHRYASLDRFGPALEVLRTPGLEPELAELLTDLAPAQIPQLDLADHAAAVGLVPPDLLASRPQMLVHLADNYIVAGRVEEYRDTIGRARALVDGSSPDELSPGQLTVIAADLTIRSVAHGEPDVIGEAEALLRREDLPAMARARLLGGLGRAGASLGTSTALRRGARRLEEGAQLFQLHGAAVHATTNRVVAATYAAWPLGRYETALQQLDEALAVDRSRVRVAVLPYRAFILIDLGRYVEAQADLAELRHSTSVNGTAANERSAAFARWAAAKMASQQGDAAATWAACHAVERSDVVVDPGHGAFFRADAAQLLARVGHLDDAERMLADARERDPGRSVQVTLAAFVVAAHAGDLGRTEALLDELDGGRAVEPRERWRVTLHHAYARHRAGTSDVRALAAAAFEEAAQLGHPTLPLVREATISQLLLPAAVESSASARDVASRNVARVRMLGTFDVDISGQVLEPSGRPGELLAFLALQDVACTTEQAIEALWPDGDPGRGRERLRTVLRRVRRECGDLVERVDDRLQLRPGVDTDVDEFLAFTDQARVHSANRGSAAAAALALYRGDLLPRFTYQSWAVAARDRLERRAIAMHALLATAAEADGLLDEAVRAHRAAAELDPTAELHHLAAARLLAEQGRRVQALGSLAEARDNLSQAGLEPSAELDRLEAYLRRDPAVRAGRAS